ncbi:MAG TPA: hypothetical protein VK137_05575 [Planctomycetaceae bacterium]|nr:hypothetical protein [Planctomycetaceae bacterium]
MPDAPATNVIACSANAPLPSGTNTKLTSNVPPMHPSVLAEYSRPTKPAASC